MIYYLIIQSVWLHMSYKWLLELLRATQTLSTSNSLLISSKEELAELRDSFFSELRSQLVCFQPPARYGRSPLEAASFIVSSAFPDSTMAGSSFLARLSGSTAEMLSLWTLLTQGEHPFSLDKDESLALEFKPILPGWLFDSSGRFSFTFLGGVNVTYHNSDLKDTWLLNVREAVVQNNVVESLSFSGGVIKGDIAKKVRDLNHNKIDIYFE